VSASLVSGHSCFVAQGEKMLLCGSLAIGDAFEILLRHVPLQPTVQAATVPQAEAKDAATGLFGAITRKAQATQPRMQATAPPQPRPITAAELLLPRRPPVLPAEVASLALSLQKLGLHQQATQVLEEAVTPASGPASSRPRYIWWRGGPVKLFRFDVRRVSAFAKRCCLHPNSAPTGLLPMTSSRAWTRRSFSSRRPSAIPRLRRLYVLCATGQLRVAGQVNCC
jgi:hypothetical protein